MRFELVLVWHDHRLGSRGWWFRPLSIEALARYPPFVDSDFMARRLAHGSSPDRICDGRGFRTHPRSISFSQVSLSSSLGISISSSRISRAYSGSVFPNHRNHQKRDTAGQFLQPEMPVTRPPRSSFDPEVPLCMRGAMQQIVRAVSTTSPHYFSVTVAAEKVAALIAKLDERFQFRMTDGQRDYARKHGRCAFRMVLFPLPLTTDLAIWVFRTEGGHPMLATERWRDARITPIQWPWLYELRRIPVPPTLRSRYVRKNGHCAINATTWTWRIRREEMDRMRMNIRHWTQGHDDRLPKLIQGLSQAPGFRGIRDDVYTIHQYVRAQAKARGTSLPSLPARRWMRGVRTATVPLSALLRRFARGATAWFPKSSIRGDTVDPMSPQTTQEIPDADP